MKLRRVDPKLTFGYTWGEFIIGVGFLVEDTELGIYSCFFQFGCWWVDLRFRVKRMEVSI